MDDDMQTQAGSSSAASDLQAAGVFLFYFYFFNALFKALPSVQNQASQAQMELFHKIAGQKS
jgi:hypothetical protein